jgi:DNA-binding MarR family transcriptional regulator
MTPANTHGGSPGTGDVVITDLFSYSLHRVASAFERGAALLFRREFDVSLGEWRALALVASGRANTTNRVARLAGIDPAQMSRVIARLVDRGYISRSDGPGNTSVLALTTSGTATYEGLISAARARNEAFLSALDRDEVATLNRALEKLATIAIALEKVERSRAADAKSLDSREGV